MNHKAHAHSTQMSSDAQLAQMREQLRERDETIVRLEGQIAELEARQPAPRTAPVEVSKDIA